MYWIKIMIRTVACSKTISKNAFTPYDNRIAQKTPPHDLKSSFSSLVVTLISPHDFTLEYPPPPPLFPLSTLMPPNKAGPWQLEQVKLRLRSEQVAREKAAGVKYRKIEDEDSHLHKTSHGPDKACSKERDISILCVLVVCCLLLSSSLFSCPLFCGQSLRNRMQDKVMRPFRPPREVKERAPPVRRSPRKGAKPDNVTHVIPFTKGFKGMSEREAQETADFGDVLRWSTDSGSEG